MKRFILIGLLGCATLAWGFAGDYDRVRPNGASTISGGIFWQFVDSSDTFQVDTFYSDTIDIGDYKYLNIAYGVTGYTLADSCNDSVTIDIKAFGTYNGMFKRALLTDSANATAGALDSTGEFLKYAAVDSQAINQLYFEIVVSDSFIAGAGETSNDDSSKFAMNIEVGQTGSR